MKARISIKLGEWNTKSVASMDDMFKRLSAAT